LGPFLKKGKERLTCDLLYTQNWEKGREERGEGENTWVTELIEGVRLYSR